MHARLTCPCRRCQSDPAQFRGFKESRPRCNCHNRREPCEPRRPWERKSERAREKARSSVHPLMISRHPAFQRSRPPVSPLGPSTILLCMLGVRQPAPPSPLSGYETREQEKHSRGRALFYVSSVRLYRRSSRPDHQEQRRPPERSTSKLMRLRYFPPSALYLQSHREEPTYHMAFSELHAVRSSPWPQPATAAKWIGSGLQSFCGCCAEMTSSVEELHPS
jgi:hypothetical protein